MNTKRIIPILAAGVAFLPALAETDTGILFTNRLDISGPATVEALRGEGALVTDGSVSVKIGPGESGRLFAASGEVELAGRAIEDDADTLVPGAYLHFDASVASTLTTEVKEDGYAHVVAWRDVDGGPNSAIPDDYTGSKSYVPFCNTPFLCDEAVSPSGLAMVDFGDAVGSARPTNCLLKLSTAFTNARELFWVGQHLGGVGACVFGGVKDSEYYFEGAGNTQLFAAQASSELREGDIRLNNQRVPYDSVPVTRFGDNLSSVYVASAAFPETHTTPANIALIGSGRHIRARTGLIRLGEILVYTNSLTSSQRSRINAYLMKKWLKDAEAQDFAAAVVGSTSGNASVSVPDGQIAHVARVAAENGELVKTGAGTLEVGALTPASATVSVQAGAVRLSAAKTVSTLAPAADPYVWLDADSPESIVTNKIDYSSSAQIDPNKYYVTRWNDRRGTGYSVYAEVPPQSEWSGFIYKESNWFQTNFPWVVAGPNNHEAIHFGAYNSQDAWMWLQPHGSANAYEGFIAMRQARDDRGRNFFGSSDTDFLRGSSHLNQLLDPGNAAAAAQAALWLFDGKVRDPILDNAENNDKSDFHVVSFSATSKLKADLLCKDRLYANGGPGDMIVGEFILYDRKLTPAERLATTAYLMKKWRNEDVPEAKTGAAAHAIAYDATIPVVIDTDEDVTISNLSGGNGELVKRGGGEVSVGGLDALTDLTDLSVDDGSLTVDFTAAEKATLETILSAALFDFDASDLSSFSNEVVTVGDAVRTNVISWADTRRRTNQIAYSAMVSDNPDLVPADGYDLAKRPIPASEHPTLVGKTMPDGTNRPAVDFGAYGVYRSHAGAGMQLRSIQTGILEVHTIYADHDDCKTGIIVGGRKEDSGYGYCFVRAESSGALLSMSAKADVINGYVAVDRETYTALMATNSPLAKGFHLISYAPLSAMKIGSIAMDRTSRCGGNAISEQIAFTRALSADERTILQKYLMRKWFGTARETKKSLDSLTVAAGSTLTLGDVAVSAATLAGAGTVDCAEVRGVSRLEIPGAVGKLSVAGEVTFADSVTLCLTDDVRRLDVGTYAVFEATSIDNDGSFTITVTGENLNPNRVYKVSRNGNQIRLTVAKKGLVVIVR